MAHINLLPWRDQRREQRKREFFVHMFLAGILGVIVVIAWASWMGGRVDNQQARNDYLKGQIHQVDAKIAKIKNLKKVRSQLLARKKIIEKLQSSRSQMVHLFDALVKTIPASVRLTSLKQNGQHLKLVGVAQSNASVATYMKSLSASPWLGSPTLEQTVNHHNGSRTPYSFGLSLTLRKPSAAKRKAAADAKKTTGTATASSVATAASVAVKQAAPASKTAKAAPTEARAADRHPPGKAASSKVSVRSAPAAARGTKS